MNKYLNLSYGAIQGTYWMYFGVIISFSSVFLLAKDYSNSEIGIILAIANILSVIIQPILADIADRSKKITLVGMTLIIVASLLVGTFALYFFASKSLFLSIIFIMLSAWLISLQPILNSMAFHLSGKGHVINFGIARSGGSIAFALLTSVLGALVISRGIQAIPTAGIIVLALFLLFLWLTNVIHKKVSSKQENDKADIKIESVQTISLSDFIKRNKVFIVFTAGIVLIFFQNSVLNNYLMQILASVGGDSGDMGRLFSFMALLELPGLIFFSQIKSRFSCQLLLKISAVAFTIKVFLTFIASSVFFIYLAFLFQLISFPIFLSASVYLVEEVMAKGEAVKGQSAVTGAMTLSAVFASLVGGVVLDYSGASLLLLISTVLCFIGTIILFATINRIRPKSPS